MRDALIELQRIALYARYVDYLSEPCTTLRNKGEAKKVAGWRSLMKSYWTDIGNALKEKTKVAFDDVLNGKARLGHCPMHIAILEACRGVGLGFGDML